MFSILTPTHNRADVINRVYDSLKHQTFKNFEWIIVDDASTDRTESLIHQWQAEEKAFNIIYHKLSKNQGKAGAINYGLNHCSQQITLIADDDDTFEPKTLEDLKIIWNAIDRTDNGNKIAAVWTLVKDEEGNLVGDAYPTNFWQVNFKTRVLDRNGPPAGEKWHSWRTKVLKEFKIHWNPNSHISPSVTWNKINMEYDFLCVNIIHRTYWYTKDGIIHKKKSKLKIEKRNYYSSFYYLIEIPTKTILSQKFNRNTAFNYIKASFYYKDPKNNLKGMKLILCFIAFCFVIPQRILYKFKS